MSGPARTSSTGAAGRRPRRPLVVLGAVVAAGALVEAVLVRLGQTYGSSRAERAERLPGDDVVGAPQVVTNHAVTIEAPPAQVWPWLVQMGWHRGGWYTARWVDRLLFPANGPSAERILPELQHLDVGDFVPDGPPETRCGFVVVELEPGRALALRSTSHLPEAWRDRARLDWTWTFALLPLDGGRRTRFLFRSRWVTAPWWFTAFGWLVVVPADLVMARDMLRGVRRRAEPARPVGPARPPRSQGRFGELARGWRARSSAAKPRTPSRSL